MTAFLIDILGTQSAPVDTCAHRSRAMSHFLVYEVSHDGYSVVKTQPDRGFITAFEAREFAR